ncbi:MAG: MarR family winged helix-turn-helix transcriptional regulator [Nitrososphaeraceae archaeon]|jgi:MarR family transcriptional regulator for hemolysin
MQEYDFENSIGFLVNRTARAFVKSLDLELREKVGVTVGQWKVIVMLVKQNGLTQKETADKLGLEGPTLIPIIDKMEKVGLLVRRVDSSDRRNNRIYRTEKADALWDRMVECATKVRQVSVKDISEENILIMRNVLDKIWQNLRVEFDVGCATADNTTIVVEPMGKSSIDTSPPSATAITATTTTTIPTTLTSTKKRKNKN